MTHIRLVVFWLSFITSQVVFTKAIAQQQNKLFSKHYNLKSGVATRCYEVLLDDQQNVLVAQPFGIDYFNGIEWKRDRVSKDYTRIPVYVRIRKDKYKKGRFVLGGKFLSGFAERKHGLFHFTKVVEEPEAKDILGGWLEDVFQVKGKTYFLGRSSGVIVYDHANRSKKVIHKLSLKSPFRYHEVNDKIILQVYDGRTYILKHDQWNLTKEYPVFSEYVPTRSLKLKDQGLLFSSKAKKIYLLGKKNKLSEVTLLSKVLKEDFILRFKTYQDNIYIKSNSKVLIFNLSQQKILFLKEFSQITLHEFDIDKRGNIWVSSDQGLFFLETNLPFLESENKDHLMKRFYQNEYVFEVTKNLRQLNVKFNNKKKRYKNLGLIHNIISQNEKDFICTSKGIFIFDRILSKLNKIHSDGGFNIFYNRKQALYYVLERNAITVLNQNFEFKVKLSIPKISYTEFSVLYQNNIFYSTTNQVIRISLSQNGKSIVKHSPLQFPRKTFSNSHFHIINNKLIIGNAYGIFEVDAAQNFKVREITEDITNLPRDEVGNYNVYFSFTHFLSPDKIFTIPVYVGVNNGKNLPLILSKNKEGKWQAYRKPFKRLEKTLVLDVVKTPQNTYEFITNDHIIEFDPNKKINTDYSFKTYVRGVKLKTKQIDTVRQKEALVDSTIYFGNTANSPVPALAYQHNTLTFTYASDSWAAYERNLYSYQLVGLDNAWSDWSKEQKKEYTHLREGTYTFKVRCKNVYGTIGSADSYTFTILPPWHRTTQAYVLYALLGLALVAGSSYGYGRYRNRKVRARNRELERVVTARTKEISDQKEEISQQAEELRTTNDKLKELSDAKESLSNMIVHDARQPLTNVINAADPEIRQSGHLVKMLLDNILEVQKFEDAQIQLQPENLPIDTLLTEAIQQVRYSAKSRFVNIENNLPTHQMVHTDPAYLVRVLVNLLSNAIKYAPSNSVIKVSAEPVESNMLRLWVQDQGTGVPDEFKHSLFQKYTRVNKADKRSTGLGLTFCKLAIEAHRGTIEVLTQSEMPQGGAAFWFTVPYRGMATQGALYTPEEKPVSDYAFTAKDIELMVPLLARMKELRHYETGTIIELTSSRDWQGSETLETWLEAIPYMASEEEYKEMLAAVKLSDEAK